MAISNLSRKTHLVRSDSDAGPLLEDFTKWFESEFGFKLQERQGSMRTALAIYLQRRGQLIVETGCQRRPDDWDAGCSTTLFARFLEKFDQGHLVSIDISSDNLNTARDLVYRDSTAGRVSFYPGDSVNALRCFSKTIDLLYLDSYDYRSEDPDRSLSQLHQLRELRAAYNKLAPGAVILLDDNDLPGGGKTTWSKELLRTRDWLCLADGKQSLWIRGAIARGHEPQQEILDINAPHFLIRQRYRSVFARPRDPVSRTNLAQVFEYYGRLGAAEIELEEVAETSPDSAEGLLTLGKFYLRNGDRGDGISLLETALQKEPSNTEILKLLASAHLHDPDGDLSRAKKLFENVLHELPNDPEASCGLAEALFALGDEGNTIALPDTFPNSEMFAVGLAKAALDSGQLQLATQWCRVIEKKWPSNLRRIEIEAGVAVRQENTQDALHLLKTLVAQAPLDFEPAVNLLCELLRDGDLQPARALLLDQTQAVSLKMLGMSAVALTSQKLKAGTSVRLLTNGISNGDIIQFIRVAAILKRQGIEVIASCQPTARALIGAASGVDAAIGPYSFPNAAYDLPLAISCLFAMPDLASAGTVIPYVRVPKRSKTKVKRLMHDQARPRIGIAWEDPDNRISFRDPYSYGSIQREKLGAFLGIPGATLFSLHDGSRIKHFGTHEGATTSDDHGGGINDLADLSALIDQMDFVITVNCPAAHIAGAMGKPVFLMLPFTAEWRWMRGRPDSPWYPSMRLFRQERPGDWDTVIENVVNHVNGLSHIRASL